jgi:hypothetical protein
MMKNRINKPIFITFGAGRNGWKRAAKRLSKQAEKGQRFKEIINLNSTWLRNEDREIYELVSQIMNRCGNRGFGYWAWKPALLNWAACVYPDSPILYIDAGSNLDFDDSLGEIFDAHLSQAQNRETFAWALRNHSEFEWTKKELIQEFNLNDIQLRSSQIQSGYIYLAASKSRLDFVRSYREIALRKNGFLLTDEISLPQHYKFIEHRHDQSVLSLLWKSFGFYSEDDKTEPKNLHFYPIIAMRNNTSASAYAPRLFRKTLAYQDLALDALFSKDKL